MNNQKNNASEKSAYSFIVGDTFRNLNRSQNAIEQQVEVPSSSPNNPQPPYQHSAYDYFVLIPGLIVATTPLVLGWLNYRGNKKDK